MKFNEFTELIGPAIAGKHEKQVTILAEVFNFVPIEDLAIIIYLCQGRLGPSTAPFRRSKGWPSPDKILERIRYRKVVAEPDIQLNVYDIISTLHTCIVFDAVSRYTSDFAERISHIGASLTEESLHLVALIFSKGIFSDKIILESYARMTGLELQRENLELEIYQAEAKAVKALANLYRSTIPDLGLIGELLRKHGLLATLKSSPQFGTIVPREVIATWSSLEQAWNKLKPNEGLFVQAKFFDGIHVQVHKHGQHIRIFNIRGNEITIDYLDLIQAIQKAISTQDFIVDCELIGLEPSTGKILRLNRLPNVKDHILVVFDILQLNGEDWREKPYFQRKSKVEELFGLIKNLGVRIYLPRERLATTLGEVQSITTEFLDKPHFEGVILKTPNGTAKTGASSNDRGRFKPYTILDSLLIGYNQNKRSFMVGLWTNLEKKVIIPYRNVEGVSSDVRETLTKFINENSTKMRPQFIGPGPAPSCYFTLPIVVAVKCDGFIIPNRGGEFSTKWMLHEGVSIDGIYPLGQKDANTLADLYGLRKRDQP